MRDGRDSEVKTYLSAVFSVGLYFNCNLLVLITCCAVSVSSHKEAHTLGYISISPTLSTVHFLLDPLSFSGFMSPGVQWFKWRWMSQTLNVFPLLWPPSLQRQVWGPTGAILCLLVWAVAQQLSSGHPGHSALPPEAGTLTTNTGPPVLLLLPPPPPPLDHSAFLVFEWYSIPYVCFFCPRFDCTTPSSHHNSPFHLPDCSRCFTFQSFSWIWHSLYLEMFVKGLKGTDCFT